MTIAPCSLGVNAAQEPNPAKGLSGVPSTLTGTSVRGQPIRTTPSGAEVGLVPAACPILSWSSCALGWVVATSRPPIALAKTKANTPAPSRVIINRLMVELLPGAIIGQKRYS